MVTDVLAETANVVTVKLADVWPAGTLTMPGTCAADELLVASVTEIPPEGEGALKKDRAGRVCSTAQRSLDVIDIDCNNGGAFGSGATLTKMDFVTPPALAKTFPPVVRPETGLVPMAKVFVLFPAAIVTLAGTLITEGLSVLRLTTPPPVAAGIARADRGATGITADNILASGAHREQRRWTGSGIDPEDARLRRR